MVLDFGLRPIEVTLSQSVLDKLKAGEARAWLVRVKNPAVAEIDLAANAIHVVPKWEYYGESTDIVVKLKYNETIYKTLSAADNDTVYEYVAFWHDVLMHENLCQTAGNYKPHVVPLKLSVTKDDVIIAEASIQVHYEPNSWHFNAQVNLVSQKLIYQRPENPVVKVFYNSTSLMSAGTLSGVIKAQSNGATIYTVQDQVTTWTELTGYWDEVDYDPDDDNNQIWYETLTFELTNTPDQTGFQVPYSFTAYSSVALAFTPGGGGLGLRITDIHVDNSAPTFTSFSLFDPDSDWILEPGYYFQGVPVNSYRPTRGPYDPGNTDPNYYFRFIPIFTGGGSATLTMQAQNGAQYLVNAEEMLVAPDLTQVFTSGTGIFGAIDISAGPDAESRIFKFFMTVDNVTSPIIYLQIGWA